MLPNNLKTYFTYYRSEKSRMVLSLFLALIQTTTLIPVSLIVQHIFDHSIPEKNSTALFLWLTLLFCLFAVNAIALLWNRHVTLSFIKSMIQKIRTDLVRHALYFDRAFYSDTDLENVHTNIVQNTERADCMTSALFVQLLPGLLISICLFILLLIISPFLSLVVFTIVPILYAANKWLGRHVKKRVRSFHEAFAQFSKGISFVLSFHELILTSSAEEMEFEKQSAHIDRLRTSSKRMAWLVSAYSVAQSNLLVLNGVIVLMAGGYAVMHDSLTIGSLISFYIALNLFGTQMKNVVGSIPTILEGVESLHALTPLLDQSIAINDANETSVKFENEICFQDVCFSYGDTFALNNISMQIQKGSTVGIVGASGSGKSTLIQLLIGALKPSRGSIVIDGQTILETHKTTWRKQIGILLQDPQIIPGTIRENLTYGLLNIDEQQLIDACCAAQIFDHINSLPQKFETEIGNRGTHFSGGQRQRIAIARALLRNPSVLILDEPDNHLGDDLLSEIIMGIKSLHLTLIVVTHNARVRELMECVYECKDNHVISSDRSVV